MHRFIVSFFLLSLPAGVIFSAPLEVGQPAPKLETLDHSGQTVSFDSKLYEGLVFVFFYPKADTPGCTRQACSLRNAYARLQEHGVRIFGVSGDDATRQSAFARKYALPYPLIPDPDGRVIEAFGVPSRISGSTRFASRQAFLIEEGRIIWRDTNASTDQQAEDVLNFLENR